MEALQKKKKEYGRGFNTFLCLETGYTSGFMSQVVNGKQKASPDAQIAISKACGINYASFFQENHKELPGEKKEYINHLEERLSKLETQLPSFQATATPTNDIEDQKHKRNAAHHEIVDEFPLEHADKAEDLNRRLLNIIKKDGSAFESIYRFVKMTDEEIKAREEIKASNPRGTGTE